MGEISGISWTDATFNLWWGCTKVSPACTHCYAEAWAKRVGDDVWGDQNGRKFFREKHWNEPLKWNAKAEKAGQRIKVFCSSMCDVFESHPNLDTNLRMGLEREKLWPVIDQTPWLDWMLLTKRPENIVPMMPAGFLFYPRPNIWLGVTAENQEWADKRIPILLEVPAAIHWLSCEPLLGPINLNQYLNTRFFDSGCISNHSKIDWVITGGESGHGVKPLNLDWVRDIREQCQNQLPPARPAFHHKQHGEWVDASCEAFGRHSGEIRLMKSDWTPYETMDGVSEDADCLTVKRVGKKAAGRDLDGKIWHEFPAPQGAA